MTEFIACQTLTVSKKGDCSRGLAVQARFLKYFCLHPPPPSCGHFWRDLEWSDQGKHLYTAVEMDCSAQLLHCSAYGVSKGRFGYNRTFSYTPNLKFASTHFLQAMDN